MLKIGQKILLQIKKAFLSGSQSYVQNHNENWLYQTLKNVKINEKFQSYQTEKHFFVFNFEIIQL